MGAIGSLRKRRQGFGSNSLTLNSHLAQSVHVIVGTEGRGGWPPKT